MKHQAASARRYGRALLDIALERNTADEWAAQLHAVATALDDEAMARLLSSPIASIDTKIKATTTLAGGLGREVETLIRMLLARKRVTLLPALSEAFADLIREHRRILHAEITTAIPLDEQTRTLLQDRLSHYLGQAVEIEDHVDPAIIGGVVARIGDRLIDGSVAGRLQRMREQIGARAGG